MRRSLCGVFAAATLLVAGSVSVPAQSQANLSIGTWRLNLSKSKYEPQKLAPKNQTATIEAAGSGGIKTTNDGVAWDGSRIAFSYTANYDGKDYPITGTGAPSGGTTIALKRVDANTFETTIKKVGRVVQTNRAVYSNTLRTITSKGLGELGQPTNNVSVYDKQP